MSPHLTRAEEQRLFAEYARSRDRKLEQRLMESQLGLVGRMAHAHRLRGIDWRDLFQEGCIGLLHAIRRFDPSRGVRLSTYAAHWIRAYQFRFLLANYRLVRLGRSQAERRIFFRLAAIEARLTARGEEPTAERIAGILGVDARTTQSMQSRLEARELSLDAKGRGSDKSVVDRMAADALPADEALAQHERCEIVRAERDRYRPTLPARRRALFDARWLDDVSPTLREMGERLGVSRERARQIEQKMLSELGERVRDRLAA
jgi:RNA polymerase sigma-32 factor